MMSSFRERFGAAGLVVAVFALIAALAGSAIAAGGLTGTQKKEVKKIAKGFQGTGPAGAQGPAGPQGPKGDPGAAGANGQNGKDGVSVTTSSFAGAKSPCTEGGVEVKSASSPALVCNGKKGDQGEPWTAGGVLPENSTETGSWAFGPTPTGPPFLHLPLQFPIPLATSLPASDVHFIAPSGQERLINLTTGEVTEVPSTKCLGTVAAPEAVSGHLCVYAATLSSGALVGSELINDPSKTAPNGPAAAGAGVTGARLYFVLESASQIGWGTWAVTG